MDYAEKYKALLAQRKAYRNAHKAEINAYYKAWYAKNKSKVAARRNKQPEEAQ